MAPRFDDTLSSLGRGEDGVSVAYPDTFLDDITAAYNDDIGVHTAKIGVLETDLAGALSQIDVLKAHNYDLMTQVPAAPSDEGGDENDNHDDSDDGGEEPDEESDTDKIFGG